MRPILVTGGAGLLGSTLVRLAPAGWVVHATERHTPAAAESAHRVDLADASSVRDLWRRLQPAMVLHTAYGRENAQRDIWTATRNVVDASREAGAALVHLSSDMVLDGERAPYAEHAEPRPILEYGRWKARAEAYVREQLPAAAVVRCSLIVSLEPMDASTTWMAAGLRGNQPPTLFVDEIRTPIRADDLALQILEIAALPDAERSGVWNLAGPEALSRFALGLLVATALGLPAGELRAGASPVGPQPRPRDLRLRTGRADAALRTRARPISSLLAPPALAGPR